MRGAWEEGGGGGEHRDGKLANYDCGF